MNIKNLLNIKNIVSFILNLKRYISFNLFSFIGWIDIIFFSCLIAIFKSDTTGLGIVYFGTIYLAISRAAVLLILLLFLIEKIKKFKIKQNPFMDNNIFNVIFCLGLLPFAILSLLVLFCVIDLIII